MRVEVVVDRVSVGDARRPRRCSRRSRSRGSEAAGRAELRAERTRQRRRQARARVGRARRTPRPVPSCAAWSARSARARSSRRGRRSSRTTRRSARARRAAGSAASSRSTGTRSSPTRSKTLADGAIRAVERAEQRLGARRAREVLREDRRSRSTSPWDELDADAARGSSSRARGPGTGGKYPGVRAWFEWLETRTYKMHVRVLLSRYREYAPARPATGARLNADRARLPRRRAEPGRVARADGDRGARARSTRSRRRATAQGKRVKEAARVAPRVPRRGRARLPHARPPGAHALGRRGAARGAHDGARRGAHRDPLRPRRAHGRPARDRRPARSRA